MSAGLSRRSAPRPLLRRRSGGPPMIRIEITLHCRARTLDMGRQMPEANTDMADEAPRTSDRPRCLEAALDYEQRRFSVILLHGIKDGFCTCGKAGCDSPGKHPISSWMPAQTKRATPAELEAAFARYPDANVGIVTGSISGLLVVDLDGPAGL